MRNAITFLTFSFSLMAFTPAWSMPQPQKTPSATDEVQAGSAAVGRSTLDLDLNPEVIESSPVLQRWLRQVPNILDEIANDPSFRTRLRLGYSLFSNAVGWNVALEDVLINRTGLTVSGEYHATFNNERKAYGTDVRYYLRPLGSYVNVAPLIGYKHLETEAYSTDGINLGARLLLVLSRPGAADISLTQSWVSPGTDEEVGLTTLSFGYAVTHHLRVSTDIQKQNARVSKDSRVGIVLEWMF